MSKSKNRVIDHINGERFTPFSLCNKLSAKVLLESASFHKGKERWSVLLIEKAFEVFEDNRGVFISIENEEKRVENKTIFEVLSYFANQHKGSEFGFPIPSGGVGYLSYEYAADFDKVILNENKKDSINIKKGSFLFGNLFLIFDHYTDLIYLLGLNYKEKSVDLQKLIKKTKKRICDYNFNFMVSEETSYEINLPPQDGELHSFKKKFETIQSEITKGNIIQAVLSRRLKIKTQMPPLDAYRNLRSINPSPYLFYFDFEDFQLFGSSPEVHVKVVGKEIEMRPIAGTRPRGRSDVEDELLKNELLGDKKELAEHLMLVDLARNDMGRVCKPGTIEVSEFMSVERYSHVMHIVSHIKAQLMQDKSGFDAIEATFPAGTVSGAPKISAMQIIDSLEEEKRGFYAGVVGWIEPQGHLNCCITIRSAVKKGENLFLQAGAGIVHDSVCENEFAEIDKKLAALLKAIGAKNVSDNR